MMVWKGFFIEDFLFNLLLYALVKSYGRPKGGDCEYTKDKIFQTLISLFSNSSPSHRKSVIGKTWITGHINHLFVFVHFNITRFRSFS